MPNLVFAKPQDSDQKIQSRTLDVFKGLAAVAMVINHSGYVLLTAHEANSGWLGLIVFLGSFAPVLFFFAVGYGAGLGPASRSVDWTSVCKKSAWLFLADQFLFWSGGPSFGLDFFGFIALSMVAIAFIQGQRRSSAICIGLIVFLLLIRYTARAMVEGLASENGFWFWFTGVRGQDGWSYPLSPWLIAPLAGFWSARNAPLIEVYWRKLMTLAIVVIGGILSAVLHVRGVTFFRWGSVSAAYFVAAVTAVAIVWVMAGILVRFNFKVEKPLSLRGASVFLVVPIHYAVLAIFKALELQTLTSSNWITGLTGMVAVTGLALTFSRQLANKLRSVQAQTNSPAGSILLCLVIFLAWLAPTFTLASALACALVQCLIATRLTR